MFETESLPVELGPVEGWLCTRVTCLGCYQAATSTWTFGWRRGNHLLLCCSNRWEDFNLCSVAHGCDDDVGYVNEFVSSLANGKL